MMEVGVILAMIEVRFLSGFLSGVIYGMMEVKFLSVMEVGVL